MDPASLPPPPPSPPKPVEAAPATQPTRRRGAIVAAFAVLVGLVAAVSAVAAWISAPGRCDGADFTSSRYAYCVETPEGTVASEVDDESGQFDRFELDGAALVTVRAVRLQAGMELRDYVEGFVAAAKDQQFTPDAAPVSVSVDGRQGLQVDLTGAPDGTTIHFRFVFVERDRVVWQMDLQAAEAQFAQHTGDLERMLDSITFT